MFVTERMGHAREIALAAVARGISTIAAWGGDGTMNEVATALAFKDVALALVPSGSGNGLARDLRIPFDAAAALDVAFNGSQRVIDAGEIDGRLFFNVAGIGLDARVAHRFAVDGLEKRGFSRYLAITMRELSGYEPDKLTVTTPMASTSGSFLVVAIANGRQHGNGATIAPHALARRWPAGRRDCHRAAAGASLPRVAARVHGKDRSRWRRHDGEDRIRAHHVAASGCLSPRWRADRGNAADRGESPSARA